MQAAARIRECAKIPTLGVQQHDITTDAAAPPPPSVTKAYYFKLFIL